MKYCTKCVQPDTRPGGVSFDENGVCGPCRFTEMEKHVDWTAREAELKKIAERAKSATSGEYDCVVGVSGGKDSTFQSFYARDRLGLRPLLVNGEPDSITEIGRANIENLVNLGFDCIKLHPNPIVMKTLVRRDFYEHLNPVKVTEYSLWASAYIVADRFDIPLIIQGENAMMSEGGNEELDADGNALNACKLNTIAPDWREYAKDGITEKDLFMFHYDKAALERKNIRGVWLGYYAKEWSMAGNAEFSISHGLTIRPAHFDPHEIGTYAAYHQLDSDLVPMNQMLKHMKFGFGQCTDHANFDIRDGHLTRDEAIEHVRRYDGKCGARYIRKFCEYIGITVEEFWRVADSFRGPMWQKDADGKWSLTDPIWEQV